LGSNQTIHRLTLYDRAVQISSTLGDIDTELQRQFTRFTTDDFALHSSITNGFIGPYDSKEVLRHVSPRAVPLTGIGFGREAYQDGECIWMIDDRCGLCEINFIKGQWRSWILEPARADIRRCIDSAVLWPMAQLLRSKGLHVIPAASLAMGDFSALILCPFGILPELSAIAANGWKIIGQRWSALRSSGENIELLHLPGGTETALWPRRPQAGFLQNDSFDLHAVYPESLVNNANCDAVIVVSSGRRPQASANGLSRWEAGEVIRSAWPIAEIHPRKRGGVMAGQLGKHCQCVEARLSPRGEDILEILHAVRDGKIGHGSGRLTLFVQERRLERAAG
jgi:hypothetical protein